jgi:dTDP-4-dehydrorhamnose reductase
MKPTILLTGGNGQVGSELRRLLPGLGEVIAPDRHELDLLDSHKVRQLVRQIRPQLIVNAAAYTAVDAAEADEVNAHAINGEAPAQLAEEAKKLGAALVHYSTDYIFDGSKNAPYDETDQANPLNVYGKTKLAGEEAIRGSAVPHLIFRTSWVYATSGKNFLLTILRLATEREDLKIVCDQTGSPTRAADIAAATCKILASIYESRPDASAFGKVTGTYHMTAADGTTWYDFAKTILEQAASASGELSWFVAATRGRPLITRCVLPITAEEYRSPTRRPAYSVLSNSRLTRTFGFALPNWRDQLHQCFALDHIGGHSAAPENPSESAMFPRKRIG